MNCGLVRIACVMIDLEYAASNKWERVVECGVERPMASAPAAWEVGSVILDWLCGAVIKLNICGSRAAVNQIV